MGLENLNLITTNPLMQNMDGTAAGFGGAPQDPMLFLQQLLAQIQSVSGDTPIDLQAMLQDGQGGMDAIKAALAALPAGQAQQQSDGKKLPIDEIQAGTNLPPELAAMLADAMPGVTGASAIPVKADETANKAENELISLLQADSQTVQTGDLAALPATDVAASVLPAFTAPSLPQASPVALQTGNSLETEGKADHKDMASTARVSLPVAVAKSFSNNWASGADATMAASKGEDFADALASVPAGAINAPAPNPIELRSAGVTAPPAVATPVGQPGWNQEFGDRIVWMTGKSMDSASIHLNPPHLGPVEVRISMNQDQQTSIQFVSGHAAVREAIEAAVPRLREMMSGQQLNLVNVDVSNQSPQQQSANHHEGRQQYPNRSTLGIPEPVVENDGASLAADVQRVIRTSSGVLNLYA